MVQEILIFPKNEDILTMKSEDVEDIESVRDLIQDLKDTLHNTKSGCGISAIQIGVPKKVCIIHYNGKDIALINPQITRRSEDKVLFREGCLSAPDFYSIVERNKKVWVTYIDENGVQKTIDQGGLFSIIVQHELDHFDGWCKVFDEIPVAAEKEKEEK